MKYNVKEHVNIFNLVEEFINKLNKYSEENKLNKVYNIKITNNVGKSHYRPNEKEGKANKEFVTLLFTLADTETSERITLFSVDYVFNDVKERLKGLYKKRLYEEFLYSVVMGFSFQLESIIKRRNITKAIEIQETLAGKIVGTSTKEDDELIKNAVKMS